MNCGFSIIYKAGIVKIKTHWFVLLLLKEKEKIFVTLILREQALHMKCLLYENVVDTLGKYTVHSFQFKMPE